MGQLDKQVALKSQRYDVVLADQLMLWVCISVCLGGLHVYSDTPSHSPLRLGTDSSDVVEQRYSQVAILSCN